MRAALVITAVGLSLAATSMTACSAGSTSATAGPAPTSASAASAAAASAAAAATSAAATSAAAAAGNAGSPGGGKSFDVCTALPAVAISQITGTKFTTTKANSSAGFIFTCDYDGSDSAELEVTVSTTGGKDEFDTDVSSLTTVGYAPDSITGVGDEAFSMPDPKGNAGAVGASAFADYAAVFGDTCIEISGLTYVTASQGKQIVEELHGKL